jgi:Pretoxin HINT domain
MFFRLTPNPFVDSHSCFQAGTPVRTISGPRVIETIRAGDQVLTQDPETGKLSFQPVVAVYHNKPNETLRISLGDEIVGSTLIHRFWKVGKGWVMARDLRPGDLIRSLQGVVQVSSVEKGHVQPVFNLQVADAQSFLVGKLGILVHDNSLVQPVLKPFDATPELGAITPVEP